jgi:hypothetical protein
MLAKNKHKGASSWLIKAIILFLLLGVIGLAIASYSGETSPGFQEYKPVNLPADLRIKTSELYIQKYPKFLPSFSKHINLNFNLANSWIEENKSDGIAFYNSWCQTYQEGSNCQQYQTRLRQNYLVATYTTNSGDELGQEAYFIKNNTSIEIILTNYPRISQQGWDKIIDSFQPTRYNHPQILRGSTQGP